MDAGLYLYFANMIMYVDKNRENPKCQCLAIYRGEMPVEGDE